VAQDADRISRDPAHRAFLDDEFERFGTRLMALDDWDDDTREEGELLEHLKGWVSKAERASQYPSGAAGGGGVEELVVEGDVNRVRM
jgi:hypothetical protein